MRILIFGNGQIGKFHQRYYANSENETTIAAGVDIRSSTEVGEAIDRFAPDVVINTAAATNLEWCGINRLDTFHVNVLGAANIAAACDSRDLYLVHYSSGCIFSSVSGLDLKVEESDPNPASYYGWSKVWSEELVLFERSAEFRVLILRPRQPVSAQISAKNMLLKMLTFSKFVDTPNSGTVIEDLMVWTNELLARRATGVYHVANTGFTTPYKIAEMLREYILPDLCPVKIDKSELDRITPNRRVDTVLDVTKLQSLGIQVEPYEDRLRQIIQELGENIRSASREDLRLEMERTVEASRQRTVVNNVYASLYDQLV